MMGLAQNVTINAKPANMKMIVLHVLKMHLEKPLLIVNVKKDIMITMKQFVYNAVINVLVVPPKVIVLNVRMVELNNLHVNVK